MSHVYSYSLFCMYKKTIVCVCVYNTFHKMYRCYNLIPDRRADPTIYDK